MSNEHQQIASPKTAQGASGGGMLARLFSSKRNVAPAKIESHFERPVYRPKTRPSAYLISLIGMVVVPTFVAAVYLAFMASDQYVAEARFAVRKSQFEKSQDNKLTGMLSQLSQNNLASASLADQETHVVAHYLRSRSAVDDISSRLDIREIFQRSDADFFSRLKKDPTIEEMMDYWRKMITTYVDGPSGVVIVKARAFRPEDAKRLVEESIVSSEALINRLSERARQDAMRKAETEVRRREEQVRKALQDLHEYRDQEGIISPIISATSTSKLLLETMAERIKAQNELYVASRALSDNAPTLSTLKSRLAGLDEQILKLKAQLTTTSADTRSISAALVRFEELEIQRTFAEKMYTLAQDALERARLRAEQQSVYLAVFVPPHLPQEAQYPERLTSIWLIAAGLMLLWGMLALTAAAIEDHTI